MTAAVTETLSFQTEVRELLQLMIHSLYSNKEIFLRELISNGSDAADKLRFEALADDALYAGDPDLWIRVEYDRDARTVTVRDNGIGMSRDEVITHIGTIAKSGTREFFAALTGDQARDARLIGQFGVGFYSAFIVAQRVTLRTRRAELPAGQGVLWESAGEGSYTLSTIERPERGTEVVLHLRPDMDEFLDGLRLRGIVRRYSDHISLPVQMPSEDPDKKDEWQTVNRASALWTRPRREIEPAEYDEFYKHVGPDFEPPLAYTHSRIEGRQSYILLLYLPKRAPFDLWDRERRHGIKLYVRRVFIMDDAEQLLPAYLRFVRGVVDSDDLPLNISREILQGNRLVEAIRGSIVKKTLDLLDELAGKEPGKYQTFWQEFGRVLKEGPAEDYANRERIGKLLRFASTHTDGAAQEVSLDAYIGRMQPEQEKIYYITADSHTAAASSPHLEIFRKKKIEVLLLSDRVDEWLVSHLSEYNGKALQSVAKGALDLGKLDDAEQAQVKNAEGALKDVLAKIKEALGDRVKDVRVSARLTESPSCLVVEEHEMALNMQHLLRQAGQAAPSFKPILELNPEHTLVRRLRNHSQEIPDWAHILHDQALLAEGGQLEDPRSYVNRVNRLLEGNSGLIVRP